MMPGDEKLIERVLSTYLRNESTWGDERERMVHALTGDDLRGKMRPDDLEVRTNPFYARVRTMLPPLSPETVEPDVSPTIGQEEEKSLVARIAEESLRWTFRQSRMMGEWQLYLADVQTARFAAARPVWVGGGDEDETSRPDVVRVRPRDLVVPYGYHDPQDAPWVAFHHLIHPTELGRYGLPEDLEPTRKLVNDAPGDDLYVELFEVHEREISWSDDGVETVTRKVRWFLYEGLEVENVDGGVREFPEIPDYPVFVLRTFDVDGRIPGLSDMIESFEALRRLGFMAGKFSKAAVRQAIAKYIGWKASFEDSEQAKRAFGSGEEDILWMSPKASPQRKPSPLEPAQIPKDVYRVYQLIQDVVEEAIGYSETMGGSVEKGVRATSEVIAAQRARIHEQDRMERIHRWLGGIAGYWLRMMAERWERPRWKPASEEERKEVQRLLGASGMGFSYRELLDTHDVELRVIAAKKERMDVRREAFLAAIKALSELVGMLVKAGIPMTPAAVSKLVERIEDLFDVDLGDLLSGASKAPGPTMPSGPPPPSRDAMAAAGMTEEQRSEREGAFQGSNFGGMVGRRTG